MLTFASCLSKQHTVSVFWDKPAILKIAQDRFQIDLSQVTVSPNIFSQNISILTRLQKTSHYDAIVFLSDGSIPLTLSKKLILHFQFPVEWVSASFITKWKLLRVSSIICNSYFTKQYIDKKFDVESKVIYPPVQMPKSLRQLKKKRVILTVGRIAVGKDGKFFKKQDELIKSFQTLVDNGLFGWELIIVTLCKKEDQKYFNQLKSMVNGYPITLFNTLSSHELQKQYEEATLYWHAAGFGENRKIHPENFEHFGIAIAEAMSYGVVPIVFNGGGQQEIVEDGKNGFLWETERELQEKTRYLIDHENILSEIAKDAKEQAKKFGEETFCEKIHKLL